MGNLTTAQLAHILASNPDVHLDNPDALSGVGELERRAVQAERDLQMVVFAEAERRALVDTRWSLLFHIPSGEFRAWTTAKRLKAMGVKPGLPDIALPLPCRGYVSAWCELKIGRNVLSAQQMAWHRTLRAYGHFVCCVYDDPQTVISILDWYLN